MDNFRSGSYGEGQCVITGLGCDIIQAIIAQY